jgi:RNA polymerase sigma-70 factor, ECF subfamily
VPANPRSWLISTGRHRAIDSLRRRARLDASRATLTDRIATEALDDPLWDDEGVEDDRRRLIFTCCHPALAPEARVALTLPEVCGLTTDEITRA